MQIHEYFHITVLFIWWGRDETCYKGCTINHRKSQFWFFSYFHGNNPVTYFSSRIQAARKCSSNFSHNIFNWDINCMKTSPATFFLRQKQCTMLTVTGKKNIYCMRNTSIPTTWTHDLIRMENFYSQQNYFWRVCVNPQEEQTIGHCPHIK